MFITSQLIDYVRIGQLYTLEPEHVTLFLQERLHWRITTEQGRCIDPRDLATREQLIVSISARKTVAGDATVLPDYFEYSEVIQNIITAASPQAGHIG